MKATAEVLLRVCYCIRIPGVLRLLFDQSEDREVCYMTLSNRLLLSRIKGVSAWCAPAFSLWWQPLQRSASA
jgi:hypothetical protein